MRSRSVRGELPGSCPRTDASPPSRAVALEDLERRRLAGSIGASGPDLALGDLEANATERLDPIIRTSSRSRTTIALDISGRYINISK